MEQIQIKVEFTGISRVLTGASETTLQLKPGAMVSDVVFILGKKFPELSGQIIQKDGKQLIPTNVFSVNGENILHESDLSFCPKNGDTLILLSLLAGG
mgnify:CR=1 FL=1